MHSLARVLTEPLEAQAAEMGTDPWPLGLAANRRNLEDFIRNSLDQRLIGEPVAVERKFHAATRDS